MVGVPEALLSDRGTNLLSHLMRDVCELLGIEKLNTTAYHPQCNGLVERFNRTLKTMIRKHVSKFGVQWDTYLHGLVWAYRNTPHDTTNEKPSFLLLGVDCRYPSEAALLPPNDCNPALVEDYREELILNLAHAPTLHMLALWQRKQWARPNRSIRLVMTNIPERLPTKWGSGFSLGSPKKNQEPIGSCQDLGMDPIEL